MFQLLRHSLVEESLRSQIDLLLKVRDVGIDEAEIGVYTKMVHTLRCFKFVLVQTHNSQGRAVVTLPGLLEMWSLVERLGV